MQVDTVEGSDESGADLRLARDALLDTLRPLIQPPSPSANTTAQPAWKCAARNCNMGDNYPAECDWPTCGCDPYADKVIAALQEREQLPTDEQVAEAMELCWDDWIADTDCFTTDFTLHRRTLSFTPGAWADQVAITLRGMLNPSQPQPNKSGESV